MAGPFGFEADKFEVSKTIASQGLLPAIESAGPTTIVVADGFSCREQIGQFAHKGVAHTKALHIAEVLAGIPAAAAEIDPDRSSRLKNSDQFIASSLPARTRKLEARS